ncbi:nucleotide sugar dehydrogenase [Roseibium sp.]|uniref:nucleotide sugar dehydrogenase n=1 Tax=Roseibium sp. TaxID=1936156 RepID=UPI003A984B39
MDLSISNRSLSVSVFGAGYVGCVSAACLSNDGFKVVAVDPNAHMIRCITNGTSPIIEPGLTEMIEAAHKRGALSATHNVADAISRTNVSFCCVGTPSLPNGTLNTSYVKTVAEQIGAALRDKDDFHVVVMRSTILPGTMDEVVLPSLVEASGKTPGVDFGVAYYPEFLRESTAIEDYYEPGAIVFGQYGDDFRSIEVLKALVSHIPVEPHVITMKSAEIVKYANNCWHAVKISFANEIGNLCKAKDIDSHEVMKVVCADRRLNISPAYMRPGFAFGGSCLPKDLRALTGFGRLNNVNTPMLDAAYRANRIQIDRAKAIIEASGKSRIGFLGVTFKENTDDLRESPLLELVETFMGKGREICIYDPNMVVEDDGGRNYVKHLSCCVVPTVQELFAKSDIVVIGNKYAGVEDVLEQEDRELEMLDLARIQVRGKENLVYHGICW